MDTISIILSHALDFMKDASPYMLFGIMAAGIVNAFLNRSTITRHLGQGGIKPIVKAAIMGIPLPICSCGIVPLANELKKKGGSAGATVSFLVSTPESGIDSISISLALLGPVMTVARPLGAFLSAMTAGILTDVFSKKQHWTEYDAGSCGCSGKCCSSANKLTQKGPRQFSKLSEGLRYSLTELWPELAPWFFLGTLIAGLLTGLLPDNILSNNFQGIGGMLLILLCSIPVYICATSSTPIAAALIAKGVSPGTALVFLLAGPATNIASLSMLLSILGKRITLIYLAATASIAIVCGLLLDATYGHIITVGFITEAGHTIKMVPENIKTVSLCILIFFYIASRILPTISHNKQ
jgi:uncharacterized membrane protein YraQ (UPF0718 family)